MLVKIASAAVLGLEAYQVEIEIDSSRGLPGQSIVGLPDAAVRESRDRVRAAIENSGFEFPPGYFTINLAPANTRKEGPLYDLPIALGMLLVSEQITAIELADTLVVGELSLDGGVRPVSGLLAICFSLAKSHRRILVPKENAAEAALIKGLEVIPVSSLKEAAEYLSGQTKIKPYQVDLEKLSLQLQNAKERRIDRAGELLGSHPYILKRIWEINKFSYQYNISPCENCGNINLMDANFAGLVEIN